jgi:hypothetical protein
MAVGLPLKTTYADGDVYSASDVNDTNGTINLLQTSTFGFAAGKNKIINGDFSINQRSFTSTTTNATFGFDRWVVGAVDGTTTYSSQAFTLGAAPVAGYEGKNYSRLVTTGQTLSTAQSLIRTRLEDVRTFAGQTVTVSFWAQSGSGTPSIAVELAQVFGTGGSPSANVNVNDVTNPKQAISTTWARYSYVISVPSISGKTLGTSNNDFLQLNVFVSAGSNLDSRTGSLGLQSNTFNIWGVQVEAGSTATAFQTASGSIGGELALCQRYYYRTSASGVNYIFGLAQCYGTTTGGAVIPLPVPMRIRPTALEQSGTAGDYQVYSASGSSALSLTAVPTFAGVVTSQFQAAVNFTVGSSLAAGNVTQLAGANASAFLGWSAEL